MSTSEESLKKAVHLIYKYSHQSKKHAKLGAVLFAELNNLQSGNIKVRDILLKKLQSDFKETDKIIPDPKRFLNEVTFLCEIFCTLRINESPIVVLGKAVMIYFERLLDGKEEELKVLLEQLPEIAEDLIMCNDKQFKDFLLKIRKKLITDTEMNIASRTMLLAVFECCLKRTKHLETEVEALYESLSGLHFNE